MTTRPMHSRLQSPRVRPLAACLATALFAHGAVAAADSSPAPRGSLVVQNCADSGAGSLRETVAGAVTGDSIDLSGLDCDTITLTGGAIAVPVGVGDIAIVGPGSDALTISGNNASRVIEYPGLETLSLSGVALIDGVGADHGGCLLTVGHAVLDDVLISGCVAGADDVDAARGGGAAIGGDATVTGSVIRGNTLDGTGLVHGGGLAVLGSFTASDSTFSDNRGHSHGAGGSQNNVEGGGVFAAGPTRLTDVVISGNEAFSDGSEVFGGGLSVASSRFGSPPASFEMTRGRVENNLADSDCGVCVAQGGGISANGPVQLTDSFISGNTASSAGLYASGGGLMIRRGGSAGVGDTHIEGTTISDNEADSAGGGLTVSAYVNLTLDRSTISGNTAGDQSGINEGGGGLFLSYGMLTVRDSTISGNTAGAKGGGVLIQFGDLTEDPQTFVNSTISGNAAKEGGAVHQTYGNLSLQNSTIAFNTATNRGGGVVMPEYGSQIDLQSTIVATNTVNGTPGNFWVIPDSVLTGANNVITDLDGLWYGVPADTIGEDPLLLALADNGGTTFTHALDSESVAVDAGSNLAGLTGDQRGEPFVRVFGEGADIGAFELQPAGESDVIFSDGFEAQKP